MLEYTAVHSVLAAERLRSIRWEPPPPPGRNKETRKKKNVKNKHARSKYHTRLAKEDEFEEILSIIQLKVLFFDVWIFYCPTNRTKSTQRCAVCTTCIRRSILSSWDFLAPVEKSLILCVVCFLLSSTICGALLDLHILLKEKLQKAQQL